MLPQDKHQYKTFKSGEFANRDSEFENVYTALKEKDKGVLIFEGERGSGKTTFLFELYRRLHKERELRPFLISLFPYSAPEFESNKNCWLDSDRPFQKEDIPETLNRLADYLEIDAIKTDDRDFQKDYFARGLAYRASNTIPVLIVDSIYECFDETRIEIDKYILSPILASERVFLVLSGRGKHPIWSRPELQNAEIIPLHPFQPESTLDQLKKLERSKRRPDEYDDIVDLSGGNPLVARVLAESTKPLPEALSDAIDIMLQDTLPEGEREEKRYLETRSEIEKLALVDIPFRIPDVDAYLYPDYSDADRRAKTNDFVALLLESSLLRYEGKGYQLNQSIVHPVRKWLAIKGQGSAFMKQLREISITLQKKYPSAKTWYQRMPAEISEPKKTFSELNAGKVH